MVIENKTECSSTFPLELCNYKKCKHEWENTVCSLYKAGSYGSTKIIVRMMEKVICAVVHTDYIKTKPSLLRLLIFLVPRCLLFLVRIHDSCLLWKINILLFGNQEISGSNISSILMKLANFSLPAFQRANQKGELPQTFWVSAAGLLCHVFPFAWIDHRPYLTKSAAGWWI